MSPLGMMVGSKCQVHTKRSLTTIPTCGWQGSTSTNTKLSYNLFTPGPSVRLVENLAEDQLLLLLLFQVPEVVLVHHQVGPLLVEVLVPHRVHAALRLYLATRPHAPFERPGIALEEMLP